VNDRVRHFPHRHKFQTSTVGHTAPYAGITTDHCIQIPNIDSTTIAWGLDHAVGMYFIPSIN
jgi:hypothetical protein